MKIAIAGYGIEGEENYSYWSKNPSHEVVILDESPTPKKPIPAGAKAVLGEGAFSRLGEYDLVVRTAGLPIAKLGNAGNVWSATNEFFEKCPAPIVGVTGTKGKGTTASLIACMFEASGRKTWLIGNIGIPALSTLPHVKPEDIVVFELSSFQLWDIQKSPQVAVVLPVEPDHLNIHVDMQDYVNAKARIARFQTPDNLCVYHPHNQESLDIAQQSSGQKVRYAIPDDGGVYVQDGMFMAGKSQLFPVEALQLRGAHNRENACAAITAARHLGLSNRVMESGMRRLEKMPHRIEYVGQKDGIEYYNDSFSSAPSATVAAVKSFDEPEILILGGVDKGSDFHTLAAVLRETPNLKHVLLIGEIRHRLRDILQEHDVTASLTIVDETTMAGIISRARRLARPGDIVLLSPGCASFDMFKDFYDRGEQFRAEAMA